MVVVVRRLSAISAMRFLGVWQSAVSDGLLHNAICHFLREQGAIRARVTAFRQTMPSKRIAAVSAGELARHG